MGNVESRRGLPTAVKKVIDNRRLKYDGTLNLEGNQSIKLTETIGKILDHFLDRQQESVVLRLGIPVPEESKINGINPDVVVILTKSGKDGSELTVSVDETLRFLRIKDGTAEICSSLPHSEQRRDPFISDLEKYRELLDYIYEKREDLHVIGNPVQKT